MKKKAFTLAEILITILIIGVVAALTMPALIANVQEKIIESQYKKAKNVIANGYRMMMSKTGVTKVENLSFLSNCNKDIYCIAKEHRSGFEVIQDTANGLTASALPTTYSIQDGSKNSSFNWNNVSYMFRTGDAMIFGVIINDDSTDFTIVTDINGSKKPNIVSKDLYKFKFSDTGVLTDISSELATASSCTRENPSGCKSIAECEGLGTDNATGETGVYYTDSNGNYTTCKFEPPSA